MNIILYLENLKSSPKGSLNCGQRMALRNYEDSIRHNTDKFEITELPYREKDIPDFIDTLRKSEVKEITVTAKSTEIVAFLFEVNDLNCKIMGLDIVTRDDLCGKYECKGIKVRL